MKGAKVVADLQRVKAHHAVTTAHRVGCHVETIVEIAVVKTADPAGSSVVRLNQLLLCNLLLSDLGLHDGNSSGSETGFFLSL